MSHIFLVLDSLLRVFLPLSMIPLSDRLLLPLGSNDNGGDHEDETRHAARHRQDDLPRTDALAVTVVAVLASIVNEIPFMLLDLWRLQNKTWFGTFSTFTLNIYLIFTCRRDLFSLSISMVSLIVVSVPLLVALWSSPADDTLWVIKKKNNIQHPISERRCCSFLDIRV